MLAWRARASSSTKNGFPPVRSYTASTSPSVTSSSKCRASSSESPQVQRLKLDAARVGRRGPARSLRSGYERVSAMSALPSSVARRDVSSSEDSSAQWTSSTATTVGWISATRTARSQSHRGGPSVRLGLEVDLGVEAEQPIDVWTLSWSLAPRLRAVAPRTASTPRSSPYEGQRPWSQRIRVVRRAHPGGGQRRDFPTPGSPGR